MLEIIMGSLAGVFEPMTFIMMIIGCLSGIIVGAIPGLSGSTGIILLLPLIYTLDMVPAIVVMAGVFCGSMYGGAIPAVLLRTPGTPSAAATSLDGYPLARQGKAGKAITVALVSSVIGGMVSAISLMLISPLLATWAMKFQAPEYFALALFGLTLIASSSNDFLKGLIAGFLGLFLGTIGVDVITGNSRFTLGSVSLMGGISSLPLLVGIFAIAQVFLDLNNKEESPRQEKNYGSFLLTKTEWKRIAVPLIIGSVIGVTIGIIPGAGGAISVFLCYELAKKVSKNKKEFGNGSIEGLAAAESSNNATTGGAMIPLLTLGVPGDAVTAVMLGAFMLVGIKPGPLLFQEYGREMNIFFAAFFIIQIIILIIGALGTPIFTKILNVPRTILMPAVLMFGFIGAYSLSNNLKDASMALIFGICGYFMNKYGIPGAPVVLGLILGPMAEQNLNRTLLIYEGNWKVIFTRPISGALMLVSIAIVAWSFISIIINRIKEKRTIGI